MEDFKPLSILQEKLLSKEELPEYYRKKREYLQEHGRSLEHLKMQRKIHKALMLLFSLNRKFIDKQQYEIISDERVKTGKPVIYAITHIGKFDYQIITEALKEHTIPFAGDPELTYRNFDGLIFNLNGVVFVDTESKTDRKVAKQTAIDVLRNGVSLMIFPEGIWNLTSEQLVMPIYPGVIDMSYETGCDIIPVAIEQYGNKFLINIGKNFSIERKFEYALETKKVYINEKKEELRQIMATLKYEIMLYNQNGTTIKRSELGTYEEERKKFVNTRLNEYVNPKTKENYFDEPFIKHRIFKNKNQSDPEDVYAFFESLDINKNTGFLFRDDESLPEKVREKVYKRRKGL